MSGGPDSDTVNSNAQNNNNQHNAASSSSSSANQEASSVHFVEPLPLQLSTVHRHPVVFLSPNALLSNPHLIPGGIVRISKASGGSKRRFLYAYLKSDPIIENSDNVAIDDLIRDNIDVKVSGQVRLQMVLNLPNAHIFDVAPLKEDLQMLDHDKESLNQFLYENYIKPYFTANQESMQPPLITLGQIFYPGNATMKIGFKVTKIEPKTDVLNDPNGNQAKSLNGAVVVTNILHQVFISDPVEGKDANAVRFEDIGGCEAAKRQLRETIELPIKHPNFFKIIGVKPSRGVLLSGPPGTGKTLMGKALANELDCFFLLINGPEIMSKLAGDSESNLRKAFEEAEKNAPSIIFIDEIDSIAPKREKSQGEVEKRVVAQLLTLMDGVNGNQGINKVFIIGATNRANHIEPALRRYGRFSPEIVIGVPDEDGRMEILKIHTRNLKLSDNIDLKKIVKDTQGFVGADIAELCHSAAMQVCYENYGMLLDHDQGTLSEEFLNSLSINQSHFDKAISQVNPSALREANVEIPNVKWSNIGGLMKVKDELMQLIQWPILYPNVMNKFGLPPSSGVLFYGPSGCGKTLMAKAIATECKANFISIKGPEVLTMWYGESESNVRDIFTKAKQAAPCVVFFDEIDSIASARGHSAGDSGVTDRVINTILTEMDGMGVKKNVFIIGATNRPDILDPAILRPGRLDQIIYIPPPDVDSRRQIINIALKSTPIDSSVDVEELARNTEGFSGADLTEICNAAIRIAVKEYMQLYNINTSVLDQNNNNMNVNNRDNNIEEMNENRKVISEKDSTLSLQDQNNAAPLASDIDGSKNTEEFQGKVTRKHFVEAMSKARKSISAAQLQRYISFAKSINASGINLPSSNTKFNTNNNNNNISGEDNIFNGIENANDFNEANMEDDYDLYGA